jgi:hypothetical protein
MYNQDSGEQPTIDLNKVENRYNQPPNQLDKPYGRERPLGVTLIAIWQFVVAGLAALITIVLMTRVNLGLSGGASLFACLYALIIPPFIAIGMGLWDLRSWARTTFLVFAVLSLLISIFSSTISGASVLSIVLIVLNVAAVIYLFQPGVRSLFEAPQRYG